MGRVHIGCLTRISLEIEELHGGSPRSSTEPGRGALRPPEPGARHSFQRPSRIASDPFPDCTTSAAPRLNGVSGRRSTRHEARSCPRPRQPPSGSSTMSARVASRSTRPTVAREVVPGGTTPGQRHDERHAMAAFEEILLGATPSARGVVALSRAGLRSDSRPAPGRCRSSTMTIVFFVAPVSSSARRTSPMAASVSLTKSAYGAESRCRRRIAPSAAPVCAATRAAGRGRTARPCGLARARTRAARDVRSPSTRSGRNDAPCPSRPMKRGRRHRHPWQARRSAPRRRDRPRGRRSRACRARPGGRRTREAVMGRPVGDAARVVDPVDRRQPRCWSSGRPSTPGAAAHRSPRCHFPMPAVW